MLNQKKIFPIIFLFFLLTAVLSPTLSLEPAAGAIGATSFPKILFYLFDFVTLFFLFTVTIYFFYRRSVLALFGNFIKKNILLILLALSFPLFAVASAFWSGSPALSLLLGIRLLLIATAVFIAAFFTYRSIKMRSIFIFSLVFLSLVESFFALIQFLTGQSLGFTIFGESNLSKDVLGLARIWIGNELFLRAYGTLPHPNILGGFQLFAIVTVAQSYFSRQRLFSKKIYGFIFALQGIGLFLSFSRTAALGLFIVILFIFLNKRVGIKEVRKILFFFLVLSALVFSLRGFWGEKFWQGESFLLRKEMLEANLERFKSSPFIGRGWGTGPEEISGFSDFPFYFFEKQPVHNIFVLVLADLGLIGEVIFITILVLAFLRFSNKKLLSAANLIAFLAIGLFDHYLLTLPIGIFILYWSIFGFSEESVPDKKTKKI